MTIEIKGKSYELRLNTKNIVQLESKIGCNPLFIFGTDGTRVPTIGEMVAILWASLKDKKSMDECYSLFDDFLEERGILAFVPVIIDLYKSSGLIVEESEKN